MNNRIWIDLTDFLEWRGNLTGIQRIQYNIAQQFIEYEGDKVSFFVHHQNTKSFQAVVVDLRALVSSGIVLNSTQSSQNTQLRKVLSLLKSKLAHKTVRASEVPFQKNDTVLIIGGMWASSYMDDLAILKERIDFTLVHFIFDMIPNLFPGYVVDWLPEVFNSYNDKLFSICDGIIAISESTARDVREYARSRSIKNDFPIKVVRIGEGIDATRDTDDSLSAAVGENFILSVSTIECRKNHLALFYALKEAKARGVTLPKIVIVGRNGWQTEDMRYIVEHDTDAKDLISILHNVTDTQLKWLYEHCIYTVFPSFYEGWGMPVAESLSYGKLCLASNTSSMPEIAGDLIDYFSPYDTGALTSVLIRYLNPEVRRAKEERIKREYRRTSWGDMFQQIQKFITLVKKD